MNKVSQGPLLALPKKIKKYNTKEAVAGFLFASPWILGFLFLFLFPLIFLVYLSLTNSSTQSIYTEFIKFVNFENVFKDTEFFWPSIINTLKYVFLSVPINLVLSLVLAMLLSTKVKGVKVYRVMFYLPTLVTIVAVTLLWKQILNGEQGILNSILKVFGISGPNWLNDHFWATPGLVLMGTWSVGGTVIIFLAGLTDVPTNLYEAANIDGAGKIRKFFKITLPTLSPVVFYCLLTGLIGAFQVFAQPMLMTGGNYNTKYLGLLIYERAFTTGKIGYAAAMSWIMLVVVMVFVGVLKFIEKHLIFYNN